MALPLTPPPTADAGRGRGHAHRGPSPNRRTSLTRESPFGTAVLLARFRGIDVQAHWSVLGILLLLTLTLGGSILPDASPGHSGLLYFAVSLVTGVVFMGSLLAHELAHSVTAINSGQEVQRITLWMLGGLSEMTSEPRTPRDDAKIAAAGPLTSLGLGIVFGAAAVLVHTSSPDGLLHASLSWLALTNIMLAVFNLLPAFPLDGGRLLNDLLWWRWRDRARSAAVAARSGTVFGSVLMGFGLLDLFAGAPSGLWLMLIGGFIVSAAKSQAYAAALARVGDRPVREAMSPVHTLVPSSVPVDEFVAGLSMAESSHDAFVVVNDAQVPIGLVTWAELEAVPRAERSLRTVGEAMRGFDKLVVTNPGERLDTLLPRLPVTGPVLVICDGRAVGTLSLNDVIRLRGTTP